MDRNSHIIDRNIAEAVDDLIDILPLKVRTKIARMRESELIELRFSSLGMFIRSELGLRSGSKALTKSSQAASNKIGFHENEVSAVVIRSLWKELRKTHLLRVVK